MAGKKLWNNLGGHPDWGTAPLKPEEGLSGPPARMCVFVGSSQWHNVEMCERCSEIFREDQKKGPQDGMHVTVWGVTHPSKKPIRAVRLTSAEDPRLLAGEFAAIVFCDHFLTNNFCVEVFGDERYNSCGGSVPTPHSSGPISYEPPLDFATWCYGPLADANEDTDLTDTYERAVRNGEVCVSKGMSPRQ